MGEQRIDVFEYNHIEIEEKYVAFQGHVRRKHPKFAPPCFYTRILRQSYHIDIGVKSVGIIRNTMELVIHSDIPSNHIFQYVDVFRNVFVTPFNAHYVIHNLCSILPFVSVSSLHCPRYTESHFRKSRFLLFGFFLYLNYLSLCCRFL